MAALARKYNGVCDFVTVYIREAHSQDAWALYSDVDFDEPTVLRERALVAQRFVVETKTTADFRVVLDTMQNKLATAFAAWPERIYIALNGAIVFKGKIGPDGYLPQEADAWLAANTAAVTALPSSSSSSSSSKIAAVQKKKDDC
jgi:type I thyroxine 5'-deiodinase